MAWANSMAPVFPLVSLFGWCAMPLIIAIEAFFYAKNEINNPIKLSVYSNIVSAIVGLLLAVINFPIMIGPASGPTAKIIYTGAIITVSAIIFHWWFSSKIEYAFAKRHNLWKKNDLYRSLFYKANGITYSIVLLVFIITCINALLELPMKT